ncbi:MAG TPA: N-acetylmuramoyl-L-alanine amidase [Hyphomicrobiaceae bacterium]|nr:N-acetylmuramoyl-L-alanine amidase [Hyphomicrobiaceae bacterium]
MAAAVALACPWPAEGTTSGPRREFVDRIIVHAIGGPSCDGSRLVFSGAPGDAQRWKDFFDRHPFLGIHYVVDRDGLVLASTPEDRVANHALNNNATSIGIELVHEGDGIEPFGKRQIDALIGLLKSIRSRYEVPLEDIKSHSEVDARTFPCGGSLYRTKMDPGANFPWGRLRAAVGTEPARSARPASPPQHRTR